MSEVVNLNKFRKAKQKADAKQTASANRTKFGRTKAEKLQDRQDADAVKKTVDDAELGDE